MPNVDVPRGNACGVGPSRNGDAGGRVVDPVDLSTRRQESKLLDGLTATTSHVEDDAVLRRLDVAEPPVRQPAMTRVHQAREELTGQPSRLATLADNGNAYQCGHPESKHGLDCR